MSANIRIRFGLQIVLVCLHSTPSHYHHCANLSEGIELIKMAVRYILSSVWVRLSILSPLSIIQYVGLYVFSLPISLGMIERMHILCLIIIIKSEVWTITHCLGLGHETMVSAVCLSIFFFQSVNQILSVSSRYLNSPKCFPPRVQPVKSLTSTFDYSNAEFRGWNTQNVEFSESTWRGITN